MNNLKCPFCNKELVHKNINDRMCSNEKCVSWKGNFYGSEDLWEELIKVMEENKRTRKALDVAVDALELFYSGQFTLQPDAYGIKADASCLAHTTLAEVKTALEQKDVK